MDAPHTVPDYSQRLRVANTAGWHHKRLSVTGSHADPEWTVPVLGFCCRF